MGSCLSRNEVDAESEESESNHSNLNCIENDNVDSPVIKPTQRNLNNKDDDGIISIPRISSSKSDILCGVSNVIYRKEYNIYNKLIFNF